MPSPQPSTNPSPSTQGKHGNTTGPSALEVYNFYAKTQHDVVPCCLRRGKLPAKAFSEGYEKSAGKAMDIFWGEEGVFGGGKFSQVFVGGERFLKFRGCVKEKRFIYVWVIF